jgi:hypothetical protein
MKRKGVNNNNNNNNNNNGCGTCNKQLVTPYIDMITAIFLPYPPTTKNYLPSHVSQTQTNNPV